MPLAGLSSVCLNSGVGSGGWRPPFLKDYENYGHHNYITEYNYSYLHPDSVPEITAQNTLEIERDAKISSHRNLARIHIRNQHL